MGMDVYVYLEKYNDDTKRWENRCLYEKKQNDTFELKPLLYGRRTTWALMNDILFLERCNLSDLSEESQSIVKQWFKNSSEEEYEKYKNNYSYVITDLSKLIQIGERGYTTCGMFNKNELTKFKSGEKYEIYPIEYSEYSKLPEDFQKQYEYAQIVDRDTEEEICITIYNKILFGGLLESYESLQMCRLAIVASD